MIKLKIKKILSILLAALLISMIGIPAFAADDSGETPAAESDYDYTKDERLSKASDPEKYKDGDFQWGGLSPAMYGIINDKMYTLNEIEKAQAIAEAKKNGAKIIVVAFHWGSERETQPDETQKTLAHLM